MCISLVGKTASKSTKIKNAPVEWKPHFFPNARDCRLPYSGTLLFHLSPTLLHNDRFYAQSFVPVRVFYDVKIQNG